MKVSADEVQAVWIEWRDRQKRPDACLLTKSRERLIRKALADYSESQIRLMIRYVYEADEKGPRFLRDGYTDLENLLRTSKVPGRVEAAISWEASARSRPVSHEDSTAFLQLLVNRAPGEAVAAPKPAPDTTAAPAATPRGRTLRLTPKWGE